MRILYLAGRYKRLVTFYDTSVTSSVTCAVSACCLAHSLTATNASSVSHKVVRILEAPQYITLFTRARHLCLF